MDSGQIKCLAFRYFNERKVLNGCDERDSMTPVPWKKGSEKRYSPNSFFSPPPLLPKLTRRKAQGRPGSQKRPPFGKKVL